MKQALKELFGKHHHAKDAGRLEQPPAAAQAAPTTASCSKSAHHDHGGVTVPAAGPASGAVGAAAAAAAAAPGRADAPPADGGPGTSSVIAVAKHCPPAMVGESWSLSAFEVRGKMYAGAISAVYRAVHRRSGTPVGLKLYRRDALSHMERHQVAREIWLHVQLDHPSIIALYAAWKDREHIYLALEWAPEGNVFQYLQHQGGALPEATAVPVLLWPTMSALDYIHRLGMIHRDVKPENILLTTSHQIKLADFGLSIQSSYEVANTRLGTVDYLAPEILDCPVKRHPGDHKTNPAVWYTNKVDVWSVGILAYELLVGAAPFEAMHPHQTLVKIRTQEVNYPASLSPGAVDFMRQALMRDPQQRAAMSDLLAHPWLLAHCGGGGSGGGGGWGGAVPRPLSCCSMLTDEQPLSSRGQGTSPAPAVPAQQQPSRVESSSGRLGPAAAAAAAGALLLTADASHSSCPQLAACVGQLPLCKGGGVGGTAAAPAAAAAAAAADHMPPADVWRVAAAHTVAPPSCGCGSTAPRQQQGAQQHAGSRPAPGTTPMDC